MRIPEGYTVDAGFSEKVINLYLEYFRNNVRNPWGTETDTYLIYTEEYPKRYPFGKLRIDPNIGKVHIHKIQGFSGRELEFTAESYVGDTEEKFCDEINGEIVVAR